MENISIEQINDFNMIQAFKVYISKLTETFSVCSMHESNSNKEWELLIEGDYIGALLRYDNISTRLSVDVLRELAVFITPYNKAIEEKAKSDTYAKMVNTYLRVVATKDKGVLPKEVVDKAVLDARIQTIWDKNHQVHTEFIRSYSGEDDKIVYHVMREDVFKRLFETGEISCQVEA